MTENPAGNHVFAAYAGFYDALYADKDYEVEVDFLEAVLRTSGVPSGASVLDLGCGTGGHIVPLARRGYEAWGVDRSPEMLEQARAKGADAGVDVTFEVGDVRTVDVGRTFDVVVSMFAVISYMLTNDDLLAMVNTARRHLEPDGLFVFDGWFGPAVLTERPEIKTKTVTAENGDTITRVATPELDVAAQTVAVHYDVTRSRDDRVVERTRESHPMRFLFAREVELVLDVAGFDLVAFGPFADLARPITEHDWNFSAVGRVRR